MPRDVPPFEMSAEKYRRIALGQMPESEWRASVKEEAAHYGWQVLLEIPDRAYQVLAEAARRDRSLVPTLVALRAWPDLFLGHPEWAQSVLVELKTAKGTLTKEQQVKIPLLASCDVPVMIWRPGDPVVRSVLSNGRERE